MEILAKQVFDETNKARCNPKSYIPYLQEMITQFKGQVLYRPGEIPLRTNEGTQVVEDCIMYLQNINSLHPFIWDDSIAKAAADHANDIGPKGLSGHTGTDGSSLSNRLNRYGKWTGKIGENIDFGTKRAKEIVMSLIVDDGVLNRGHRSNIFSKDFVKTGIACSTHKQWEICTILDYTSSYISSSEITKEAQISPAFSNFFEKGSLSPLSQTLNNYPTRFTTPMINQILSSSANLQKIQEKSFRSNYENTPLSTSASQAVNYESLSKEAYFEQNRIRQNPQCYIPYLEEYVKNFKGMIVKKPGETPLRTHEGADAVQDCIQFLKQQKPINPLEWDKNLAQASKDHATDIGPKSLCGHTGSDGSSMSSRLEKYGEWNGKIGESCDFGNLNGRDIIISLIVDDGVSNRGHRINLFSTDFKKVGVACSFHSEYKVCCVFDYATEFHLKGKYSYRENGQNLKQQMYPFINEQQNDLQYSISNHPSENSYKNNIYQNQALSSSHFPFLYSQQLNNQQQVYEPTINNLSNKLLDHGNRNKKDQQDLDKPLNTIETIIEKNVETKNGIKSIQETKTYKLANGQEKIIERTYFE